MDTEYAVGMSVYRMTLREPRLESGLRTLLDVGYSREVAIQNYGLRGMADDAFSCLCRRWVSTEWTGGQMCGGEGNVRSL